MLRTPIALALLAGCSDDAVVSPDSPVAPTTLLGVLIERGPLMENYVWHSSYTSCGTCEELTVIEFAVDHYDLRIFTRESGQTAALHCTARFDITEIAAAGFDPLERTQIQLSIGANDCGYTTAGPADAWVIAVAARDGDGKPTDLAWWPALTASSVTTFPGYLDLDGNGLNAAPLVSCIGAPSVLCEPACDLGNVPPGGCGLAAPID